MTNRTSILARTPAALAIMVGTVIVGAVLVFQGFTFLPVIGIFLGLAVMWWGVMAGWRVLSFTERTAAGVSEPRSLTEQVPLSTATATPEVQREDDGSAFPVPDWIPAAGPAKVEPIPPGS